MKNIGKYILGGALLLSVTSCQSYFLDLEPLDSLTESAYFDDAEDFKQFSNSFYNKIIGLKSVSSSNVTDFMDYGSDLAAYQQTAYSKGTLTVSSDDTYWTNAYDWIRDTNTLLEKADEYSGDKDDLSEYVAAAKFFRAYHHFFLMQRFGGVPIVTKVLDLDSPELFGARSSRYEVTAQIIADLDDAIADLPTEQNIASSDKGKVSRWAAKAFKARVLLHEASWMKYVGTTTDGDGNSRGAGSAGYEAASAKIDDYFQEVVELTESVIDDGGYSLWNYDESLDDKSMYYLFCLEDEGSNPAGLTKSSNNEFIFYHMCDYDLYQGSTGITHSARDRMAPSRKMMDMILCEDGLPVDKSPLFEGYFYTSDEYKNRDKRMLAYFSDYNTGEMPADGSVSLTTGPSLTGDSGSGYYNNKFCAYNYPTYRSSGTESQNIPHIRLGEIYLMYAEAMYELYGELSDSQMDYSINMTRARAGLPALTNEFLSTNDLDLETEIRRERAVEMYMENSRYPDLRRWGIAEEALNADVCGSVIEGTNYAVNPLLYDSSVYPNGLVTVSTGKGDLQALCLDAAANRNFQRYNYLYPIPTAQILLNGNLLQNPEY